MKRFLCVLCCCLAPFLKASGEIPCEGNFYVGGGYLYTVTNLPQNVLTNDFSGFARQPSVYGEESTQRTDRKSHRCYVYGGYQVPIFCCWRVGAEIGYKNLGRKKDRYIGELNIIDTAGNVVTGKTPFREVHTHAWDALLVLRYQHTSCLNFFAKAGAAWLKMKLKEGNFFSTRNPAVSFQSPFAKYDYRFFNVYPEVVVGAGFLVAKCVNIVASYGHIFGPKNTARYIQDFVGGDGDSLVVRRPGQCASYDFFTVGIEYVFPSLGCCRS